MIPSHVETSSSESVSTSAGSTLESEAVTREESGPEVYPIVPGDSQPPSSCVGDGMMVIPLAPSLGTLSVHAPSAAAPSVHMPSVCVLSVNVLPVASHLRIPESIINPHIP
ncbi:hypothetical protein FRC11_005542, partial [Ceratobasidium sp. 423]